MKRKTLKFEDGALRVDVNTNESILYNEKCEKKAKGKPGTIVEGTECSLQQYEIEIDCEMKEDEFASGMAFAHIDLHLRKGAGWGAEEAENYFYERFPTSCSSCAVDDDEC